MVDAHASSDSRLLRRERGAWHHLGCLPAAILLVSCADQQKARETQLTEILLSIAGHYDNNAQVEGDVRRGLHPPHDALALAVVPMDDPIVGDHAFYVQEMAADDPRRVMVQRVWTLEVADKRIVQKVWTLREPLRWRDAQRDPDLLRSMVSQDVSQVRGCDLTWKKTDSGFSASNDPKTCRSTSRVTGGAVQIDTRMELDAGGFGLAENATDAAGRLVQGRTDEPFIRFRRASQ